MELLNALSKPQKRPFQVFKVTHGIEVIDLKVPLAQADAFQQAFEALSQKDKPAILQVLAEHGGSVLPATRGAA